jgi:exopolyphosphatase / guanosine-5'-triphosphate,3'-diphosphate pyrophosphatase
MRLAVIDCGTNTFHLLVVDMRPDYRFEQVYKQRQYVRLGQEGLEQIGAAPFQRGIDCIAIFKEKMEELGVDRYRAFGTEALRRANNGQAFLQAVQDSSGVEIQLISGDVEARLIHLGVKQAVPFFEGKTLIMDIGGGSVEFIIASEDEVFWAQSFHIGVQVLFTRFQKNDPIHANEITAIHQHFDEVLEPLHVALRQHETPLLTGASGSFEVVEDMLRRERQHPLYTIVSTSEFYKIHEKISTSTHDERLQMPGLPPQRAELIAVAFVLMDYVIKKAGIQKIVTSAYAMKEGMLLEMGNGVMNSAGV